MPGTHKSRKGRRLSLPFGLLRWFAAKAQKVAQEQSCSARGHACHGPPMEGIKPQQQGPAAPSAQMTGPCRASESTS